MSGFSSEEKELAERLMKAGIQKNEAKVLVALIDEDNSTRKDIANRTSLSQPEISIAVQGLEEKGWVSKKEKKKNEKGRPVHLHTLSKDFSEIIKKLEEEKKKKIKEKRENIQMIKDLSEEVL